MFNPREKPDVVFLQEVVSPTLDMIRQSCSKYTVHVGVDGPVLPVSPNFS